MTERDIAIQIEGQIWIPEFQPFQQKDFVGYLKRLNSFSEFISSQQKEVHRKMRELSRTKIVNGWTEEERISEYAYGNRTDDSGITNGNPGNPDALYIQWLNIYEPVEREKERCKKQLFCLNYEQDQADCVRRCIDSLPLEQRALIREVFIEHKKVKNYCRLNQLGHGSYDKLKKTALSSLLETSNTKLELLHQGWVRKYEESFMDTCYNMPSGRPVQMVSGG